MHVLGGQGIAHNFACIDALQKCKRSLYDFLFVIEYLTRLYLYYYTSIEVSDPDEETRTLSFILSFAATEHSKIMLVWFNKLAWKL